MIITLIRVTILYCVVMVAMRLMGKRQVGELQPTELVITILLSELVAIPIQDNSIPMATSLLSAAVLVAFEILNSVFAVRSNRYRTLTQGHTIVVIRDGTLDLRQLRNLRISVDDLMEALRQKDVFDISEVQYAIVETTGKISVLPKPEARQPTGKDMNLPIPDTGLPFVMVYDGEMIPENFPEVRTDEAAIRAILRRQKTELPQVMLLTVNKAGEANLIRKDV
ncbi:MAG: DUF421 domain-containing protein [Oscillospiraceae bacterium]|jgi:uncharacterized membrane protein YcaP (DUF421 family)|nr:DUF421 domain-containing protein [Oscillospiraceae bacterium]